MTYEYEILQQHHVSPHNDRRLPDPTHTATGDSGEPCHDVVTFEARVSGDGKIQELCFSADSCMFCASTASLLTEFFEGRFLEDIHALTDERLFALFNEKAASRKPHCVLFPLRVLQSITQT